MEAIFFYCRKSTLQQLQMNSSNVVFQSKLIHHRMQYKSQNIQQEIILLVMRINSCQFYLTNEAAFRFMYLALKFFCCNFFSEEQIKLTKCVIGSMHQTMQAIQMMEQFKTNQLSRLIEFIPFKWNQLSQCEA